MGVQSAFPRATNYTGGETLSGLTRVAEDAHSTRLRCGHLLLAVLQALAVLVVSLAVDSGHGCPDLRAAWASPCA